MLSRVLLKERTAKKAFPTYGPEQTFPLSPSPLQHIHVVRFVH